MRKFQLLLILLLSLYTSIACAQRHRLRIMEYNVENLFDTLHAETKSDLEFTPQGEKQWTERRYWSKLGKICRVIAATGETVPVDLVALIEVENDSTLSHLTHRTKLLRLGYEYIISHSEDLRGINVALLYQPHRFRPIMHDSLRISPCGRVLRSTRDILHVCGELTNGDTLDLFICHFPSRKGGKPNETYRTNIARTMRAYTDSLMQTRKAPYIVITGDFNAFYPERCLKEGLSAMLPSIPLHPRSLYLLSHNLRGQSDIHGTYKFQGEWNQLDHFIVNDRLLHIDSIDHHIYTTPQSCRIVDFPFLLRADRNGDGVHPHRSFLGNYYSGGYSDHLPLLLDLFY